MVQGGNLEQGPAILHHSCDAPMTLLSFFFVYDTSATLTVLGIFHDQGGAPHNTVPSNTLQKIRHALPSSPDFG